MIIIMPLFNEDRTGLYKFKTTLALMQGPQHHTKRETSSEIQ